MTAMQRYLAAQMSHRRLVFHLARYVQGAGELRNITELAIEATNAATAFL